MFHFKAQHSTGTVHLRQTSRRPDYTYAVVGKNISAITCHRTRQLAITEQARQLQRSSDREVVPLEEIDKAEYARLKKASKRHFSVSYLGKTYTKTINADWAPVVAAVGYDYEAYSTHHTPEPGTPAAAKHPNGWDSHSRARRGVTWFHKEGDAERWIAGTLYSHNQPLIVGQNHLVNVELLAVTEKS